MNTCLALSRAEAKAGFLAAASSADPAEVLPGNSLLMLHSEQTDSTHLYTHSRLHHDEETLVAGLWIGIGRWVNKLLKLLRNDFK